MKGLENVRAYIRGKGVVRTDIAIENGVIVDMGELSVEPIFDCGDLLLSPGFIDTHIHGAGGADVMDGTRAALSAISATLVKEGTTAFLATTMTQSVEAMKKAVSAAAEFGKGDGNGATILGVHAEGPFISEKYAGAQPREYIVPPSVELFDTLQTAAKGNIKIVTLAPETDGQFALTKHLEKAGVVASVGHSGTSERTVREGIKCGLTRVTHTFNACSPLHHREAGVVGSALLYDELYTELIADTIHVSVPAMKLLIKNKPKNKVVLITDAMRAKGMPDGVYELGGQTVYVKSGRATLADGTLAGSVLKMNEAVKNTVEKCGVDICTALDFASYNAAESVGMEDKIGSIKIGNRADFTLLDGKFDVAMTAVDGRVVYKR